MFPLQCCRVLTSVLTSVLSIISKHVTNYHQCNLVTLETQDVTLHTLHFVWQCRYLQLLAQQVQCRLSAFCQSQQLVPQYRLQLHQLRNFKVWKLGIKNWKSGIRNLEVELGCGKLFFIFLVGVDMSQLSGVWLLLLYADVLFGKLTKEYFSIVSSHEYLIFRSDPTKKDL